jgi:hypothetical protein
MAVSKLQAEGQCFPSWRRQASHPSWQELNRNLAVIDPSFFTACTSMNATDRAV